MSRNATLESVIERHLCRAVKRAGGEVRKMRWIGRRGAPDRFVLLRHPVSSIFAGHSTSHLWVELKRPGGKLMPEQEREIATMRASGCAVLVFDTKESIDFFFMEL